MLPLAPEDLRRRRLIVLATVVVLLMAAFTAYVVLTHQNQSRNTGASSPSAQHPSPAPNGPSVPAAATQTALRRTTDPEAFARTVAGALFEWDTATLVRRSDHIEQLMVVADPTGESTIGLLSDLDGYFPTQAAWRDLAQYETRQWLAIESVTVPTKWAQAKIQAGGELLDGTAAFTVEGTRHRAGVWNGEPVASQHKVAFTIFVVCGPAYPQCHLLRLSILDKPLD